MVSILGLLDSRLSLKFMHRRLQLLARFLIVGTFIDDAIRIAFDYAGQKESMGTVGFPEPITYVLPALFVLVQAAGVGLVLAGEPEHREMGCIVLTCWTAVHPFLYLQQRNLEFVLESLTIMGGLIILLSNERVIRAAQRDEEPTNRFQFIGRMFLSAVFVYYVVKMIHERIASFSGSSDEDIGVAVVEGLLLVLLLIITGLIVVGLQSRWCAGVLAVIMAFAALYKHPWFLTIWSSRMFTLDFVVGYEGVEVPGWLYSDHQRYFFFQQLSTAGALLQLVVHGPGRYSIDEADGPIKVVALTAKGTD